MTLTTDLLSLLFHHYLQAHQEYYPRSTVVNCNWWLCCLPSAKDCINVNTLGPILPPCSRCLLRILNLLVFQLQLFIFSLNCSAVLL